MICWKIRIFAYWTTPWRNYLAWWIRLWFAEKFVSLLIEQHRFSGYFYVIGRCDLLKNSYLCLLNNTQIYFQENYLTVVICWKIRIFAYWTTPQPDDKCLQRLLWFAEKFVSLLIEQHRACIFPPPVWVVICWKIRIFAYWTTPPTSRRTRPCQLWFAEKFVSLLIEQHRVLAHPAKHRGCDLLKNSYLCLLNNTSRSSEPRKI